MANIIDREEWLSDHPLFNTIHDEFMSKVKEEAPGIESFDQLMEILAYFDTASTPLLKSTSAVRACLHPMLGPSKWHLPLVYFLQGQKHKGCTVAFAQSIDCTETAECSGKPKHYKCIHTIFLHAWTFIQLTASLLRRAEKPKSYSGNYS